MPCRMREAPRVEGFSNPATSRGQYVMATGDKGYLAFTQVRVLQSSSTWYHSQPCALA